MSATPFAQISQCLVRSASCAGLLLGAATFAFPAQADSAGVTVIAGMPVVIQSSIAVARSEQSIRITVEDSVRPGILRAPVAEPVLYVIESDDAVRAIR